MQVTLGNGSERTLTNPAVSIDGIEGDASVLPYDVVALPDLGTTDLPSIESADDYPLFDPWIKPHEHALLNTTSLEGGGRCDGFPDFRHPLPLDGSLSPPGTFPAVFGRSADAASGEEVVFAYDPHLALYENTVENPVRVRFYLVVLLVRFGILHGVVMGGWGEMMY